MRRLLVILFILFSISGFSQSEVIRYEQYGNGSLYAHLYLPAGWDTYAKKGFVIYLPGAGARGTTSTDTSGLDGEGPPRYIRQGANPALGVISIQILNSTSLYPPSAVLAAINHVTTNYGADPDMIYLDGYSLGYTGVLDALKTFGYRIAAAHGLAGHFDGGLGWNSAYADSVSRVPIRLSHAGGDATQPIGNSVRVIDSILNPNHTLKTLPQTSFFFGSSHGASDELVYVDYESDITRWFLLHHRNIDSTAEFHVDSLERAGVNATWNLFTRTEYIVNNLSASAHKTDLLARLVNIKNDMNGGSNYTRVVLDLGVAAKTSTGNINNMTNGNTGQIISNMIDEDGVATTWDFRIVARTNTTEEADAGEPRGYWIWNQANAYDDQFSVFNINTGSWRIEGLDNTKTYTIRMTGGGASYSAGTRYGLDVTINGTVNSIPLVYKNTDGYVEFKGVVPTSGNITIEPDGAAVNAVAGIAIIEIIEEGSTSSTITVTAPNDVTHAYNQDNNTPSFTLTATPNGGIPTTWLWTQISGPNTATLTNANTATVTVSGTTKGEYVFRVTVDSDAFDEVSVYIRDYNQAGKTYCREGGGRRFEIGNTILSGKVSTTWINIPYVNRDLVFGELVLGGDTIFVHQNPNNIVQMPFDTAGMWRTMVIGGFGGDSTCPVVVAPYNTNPVYYGAENSQGYFRFSSGTTPDSNFSNYVKIDGMAHRQGNRYVYGFQHYSADSTGIALVAHHFRNLEVCGLWSFGGIMLMKADSDSTKEWTIYNNYNPGPADLHDIYGTASKDGEFIYLGHTYPNGALTGNDGPTTQGAGGSIRRVIATNIGWDGIQVSNYGRGFVISNNMTYKTGLSNQSSQQGSIVAGGYTQFARIDSNVCVNGTGGINVFGMDTCHLRRNIVDSVINGGAIDYDNVYVTQTTVSSPPPLPDSLVMYSEYNLFNRMEETAINHANANGRMKAGFIRYNRAGHPTRTANQLFFTNAGCEVSNNTVETSIDLDTEDLSAHLPAWRVYKLVSADQVTKYSFFDVEFAPKYRAVKQIGKRLIYNPRTF